MEVYKNSKSEIKSTKIKVSKKSTKNQLFDIRVSKNIKCTKNQNYKKLKY